MRRWLALSLGLLVAIAAGVALLTGAPGDSGDPHAQASSTVASKARLRAAPAASAEIGADSRRQLEAILAAEEGPASGAPKAR